MLSPLQRVDGHGELTGVVPFDHQPSVALAIVTAGPAGRLRALLEIIRPHVDEIVVGIDQNGDPDTFDASADLADRRLSLDVPGAAGRPRALAWVHYQCTADWILGLDADEVPSAALLAGLSTLVADRRPAALCLETRWVYPDTSSYIVSPQWKTDMRPRIVRNLPGMWRFQGAKHTHVELAGELRYVDLPIYHVELVIDSREDRLRKARVSEQQPGRTPQDFRLSDIYLPEVLGDLLETKPVGAEDRPLIDALVAPAPAPVSSRSRGPDGHGGWAEIDQFNDREGPLEPGDYRAALDLLHAPATVPAQADRRYLVCVRHEGLTRWPAGERQPPLIRLGYRWVEEASGSVTMDGRGLLSESVMPGETTLQLMCVHTPSRAGRHRFEIDLVHEHVRWFGCPLVVDVEVEGQDRVALRAASPAGDDAAELQALECELAEIQRQIDAERELRTTLQWRLAEWLSAPLDRLRARRR